MIQRIQSLYLLGAALLTGSLFRAPLATFTGGYDMFRLYAQGIRTYDGGDPVASTPFMLIALALCVAVPVVTIFLFKKRRIQAGLCLAELVLLVGMQLFIALNLWQAWKAAKALAETMAPPGMVLSAADFFPLPAMLLVWLAFRAIVKDEALVRSLDRIR